MCAENQEHEGYRDANEENLRDFTAMMKRWGIEALEEAAKPLGIDMLIEGWCNGRFGRPTTAAEELRKGHRQCEAAAALFAYCYSALSPSFFGWTLAQCTEWHLQGIEDVHCYSKSDQQTIRFILEHHQHSVMVCRDLIDFVADYSSGRFMYPEGEQDTSLGSCVDILLTATLAVACLSGQSKAYDPYLCEHLERAYQVIRQGKVQQAQQFSTLNLSKGRELSGDVEGFLACLGCAAVCYSLAWTKSELSPEHERDYEAAFKAYVHGAKYMCKTDYYIGSFFNELFTVESEKGKGGFDIYWKIIGTWEEVRRNTDRVYNWRELQECLKGLKGIMYSEDHEEDWGFYPNTEAPGEVYLEQQISFCDGRLSHKEILQVVEQQKRDYQEKRLRTDFFGDLWWDLELGTRERVISAEYEWYDGFDRRSYVRSAIEHYSAALEIELRALVFSVDEVRRCVKGIIDKQRDDRSYRRSMQINSRTAESLNLKDISKLLRYAMENRKDVEPIRKAILALPVAEHKKALFSQGQFLEDLLHVYLLRIDSTHTLENPDILLRTRDLRRRILGIGCDGYLVSLATMKKRTHDTGLSTK